MSDRLSRKRNVDSTHGSRDSSTSSQVRCGCQYFQTDSLLPEKQSLIGLKPNITTIMNTLSKTNDMVAPTADGEASEANANVADQPSVIVPASDSTPTTNQGSSSPAAKTSDSTSSTAQIITSSSSPKTTGRIG